MVDLSALSDNIAWTVAIAGGLVTLAVLARKAWRRILRAIKTGNAVVDTLVGREAIHHPETGREIVPASPGIGARMVSQEEQAHRQGEQMVLLTNAVSKIADSHARLEHVESRIDAHDKAIAELKAQSVERVVTRAESAAAWRAVEAVASSSPPDDDQP